MVDISDLGKALFVDAEGLGPVEAEIAVEEEVALVFLEGEEHGDATCRFDIDFGVVFRESREVGLGGAGIDDCLVEGAFPSLVVVVGQPLLHQ